MHLFAVPGENMQLPLMSVGVICMGNKGGIDLLCDYLKILLLSIAESLERNHHAFELDF